MLAPEDAQALFAAGYKILRPLTADSRRTWLAARLDDNLSVVVRRIKRRPKEIRLPEGVARHVVAPFEVLSGASGRVYLVEEYLCAGQLLQQFDPARRPIPEVAAVLSIVLEQLRLAAEAGCIAPELSIDDVLFDGHARVVFRSGVQWQLAEGAAVGRSREAGIQLLEQLGRPIPGFSAWLGSAPALPNDVWGGAERWLTTQLSESSTPTPPVIAQSTTVPIATPGIPETSGREARNRRAWLGVVKTWQPGFIPRRGRPLVVAAATAVVTVGALLFALPGATPGAEHAVPPVTRSGSIPSTELPGIPLHTSGPGQDSALPSGPVTGPLGPVDAVRTLIDKRTKCRPGAECALEEFDQPGSAQWSADAASIAAGAPIELIGAPPVTAAVTSDMGGAVLLAVTAGNTTASVLLMQTEAGWRIRDVFD